MAGPMHGLRVVELAGIGPGPHAAMMLGHLGADVLHIERVPDDVLRHAPASRTRGGCPRHVARLFCRYRGKWPRSVTTLG
ncbi:MAG: CoA transferase [Mycobacterium sp.]